MVCCFVASSTMKNQGRNRRFREACYVLGMVVMSCIMSVSIADTKYELASSIVSKSTSLTCQACPFRSRLAASVACTEDAGCRAVWSYTSANGQKEFAVCTCMEDPSLRTESIDTNPGLHAKVGVALDKGILHKSNKSLSQLSVTIFVSTL